jgi:hypothetical protein
MTNPNGTRFETACVRFINSPMIAGLLGVKRFHAYRIARSGRNDKGDIQLTDDVILECKATRKIDLAEAMNQLKAEVHNSGATYGAAVIKRRQKSVGQAYAVMELGDFLQLIAEREGTKIR